MRRTGRLLGALCVLGILGACAPKPETVGQVRIDPHRFELPHGSVQPVQVAWAMLRPLPDDSALVFLHLVDEKGAVRRTFDHPFPGSWTAGEKRTESVPLYHSAIGPSLPSGTYDLVIGVQDDSGERWPLRTEGKEAGRLEYAVAEIEVPEPSSDGTRFAFGDGWMDVEAGTDVQVVARRWLGGAAVLEVIDLPADAAEVWMVLRVPRETEDLRLVLAEGSHQPSVLLTTDCSGFEAEVSGPGFHEIRMPIDSGAESCRLRLVPSFHFVETGSQRRLAASLEQLGYR